MRFSWGSVLLVALVALPGGAPGQEARLPVDAAHPRLFLTAHRLRLLRRERERQSMRWNQFQLLMAGKAAMPEPGFAGALYYQVSGDSSAGQRAVTWALEPGSDLRQLALVFDWCQDLLSESQSKTLAARLARGIQQTRHDSSMAAVRSRLLAAIALAGNLGDISEREFGQVQEWWENQVAPALRTGRQPLPRYDSYALMEILHAIRDNLNLDLRDDAPEFFKDLPMLQLLSYYPASYPAGENEFRIPAEPHPGGEPDLRRAAFSRAAELSMVAYDGNAPGSQFLQGWLMNDNFLMRGVFGIPYEFLWANPYQPGLSYDRAPLVLHDELFGRLFVRSSWEESASWLGYFDGGLQLFQDGRATELNPHRAAAPLQLTRAEILFGNNAPRLKVAVEGDEPVFVVGLKPEQSYAIEVDDEEMAEAATDAGGILALDLPHDAETGVRWREAPAPHH